MNKKSFTLLTSVLLIAVVAVAVLGLTVFVVQHIRRNTSEANRLVAVYLARAGIQDVAYQYRKNGWITLGAIQDDTFPGTVTVNANQAGLLLVNTPSGRVLDSYSFYIRLKNVASGHPIRIRGIRVSWTPDQNEWVRVRISGGRWSRWRRYGQWIPYYYTLSNTSWRILYVRFNRPTMYNKSQIDFTFEMGDGSQTQTISWYASPNNINRLYAKFTVNATGTVDNVSRTIDATIDVSNSSRTYITSWKEIYEKRIYPF